MYGNGHYGAALLCYAPVGFGLQVAGFEGFAVLGGALSLAFARSPDVDLRLPLVSHRGITHTVWFVALVAGLAGAGGWLLATPLGLGTPLAVGGFTAAISALSVVSHLLADVITPAGVTIFWPVSDRTYTVGLVRADNWIANQLLLAGGVFAVALVTVVTNPGLITG